ncbi:MAG: hypothetical protein ACYYK0_06755, partial [Candidatus Eutrophobiaceae bacterium]
EQAIEKALFDIFRRDIRKNQVGYLLSDGKKNSFKILKASQAKRESIYLGWDRMFSTACSSRFP